MRKGTEIAPTLKRTQFALSRKTRQPLHLNDVSTIRNTSNPSIPLSPYHHSYQCPISQIIRSKCRLFVQNTPIFDGFFQKILRFFFQTISEILSTLKNL